MASGRQLKLKRSSFFGFSLLIAAVAGPTPSGQAVANQNSSSLQEIESFGPVDGPERVRWLLSSQAGNGKEIRMDEYFPSLNDKKNQILRRSYRSGYNTFYLQQIIDPTPDAPGSDDIHKPEFKEASNKRLAGAHYYRLYDIKEATDDSGKATGKFYYADTWHMRNSSDGAVVSIMDDFVVLDEKGRDRTDCQWPHVECRGRGNYYFGDQKLVFGGKMKVGDWSVTRDTYSNDIQVWPRQTAQGPHSNGPDPSYAIWSKVYVLEHYDEYTLPVAIDGKKRTYKDVIKVLHGHGAKYPGMDLDTSCPMPEEIKALGWPAGFSSYYQVQWLAKGVGFIQKEVIYTQQVQDPQCKANRGTYSGGLKWTAYLEKASLQDRTTGKDIVADLLVEVEPYVPAAKNANSATPDLPEATKAVQNSSGSQKQSPRSEPQLEPVQTVLQQAEASNASQAKPAQPPSTQAIEDTLRATDGANPPISSPKTEQNVVSDNPKQAPSPILEVSPVRDLSDSKVESIVLETPKHLDFDATKPLNQVVGNQQSANPEPLEKKPEDSAKTVEAAVDSSTARTDALANKFKEKSEEIDALNKRIDVLAQKNSSDENSRAQTRLDVLEIKLQSKNEELEALRKRVQSQAQNTAHRSSSSQGFIGTSKTVGSTSSTKRKKPSVIVEQAANTKAYEQSQKPPKTVSGTRWNRPTNSVGGRRPASKPSQNGFKVDIGR